MQQPPVCHKKRLYGQMSYGAHFKMLIALSSARTITLPRPNVKRYLQVASVASDGLHVVKRNEPVSFP